MSWNNEEEWNFIVCLSFKNTVPGVESLSYVNIRDLTCHIYERLKQATYFWLSNNNFAIFCKPTLSLHATLLNVLIDNIAE
jgi:hypothetical protein